MSNVFLARSLTKGRAMIGILSLALGCWVLPPTRSSSDASILYGTDMAGNVLVGFPR